MVKQKKRLSILIFSWRGSGHPHAGGAEAVTFEHAKAWVKAGHNVTIFTSTYLGAKTEEVINGVRIIRKGGEAFGVKLSGCLWYLSNKEKFDLVVDEFHGLPFFTPLYVRGKKLGFIHEVAKEVWRLNPWPKPFNLIPGILGTAFEPKIFKFIYKTIPFMTVSDSTKKDLVEFGIQEEKVFVIENGVSIRHSADKYKKEKVKTLLYLGSLSRDKGIEDALTALSLLIRNDKNWRFGVIGKGSTEYVNFLKSRSAKLGISKYTKFWGFVSDKKKFELLERSHLLINPSIREGWGLVVIEAASKGTPTVGYNVPGLRDSIVDGKTGVLCSPNPESLANEVAKLMNNAKKYKVFSGNCIKWSKKFFWSKSTKKSLALINKIYNEQRLD